MVVAYIRGCGGVDGVAEIFSVVHLVMNCCMCSCGGGS